MVDLLVDENSHASDVRAALRHVVTNFSEAPLRNGKLIRDFFKQFPEELRTVSIELLKEGADIRGCRYLVTVLWVNDSLLPILGDNTLPKDLCLKVARTAAMVDPQLQIRLIRHLVAGMLEGRDLDEFSANRLLEVLGEISNGNGTQHFIRQMLRHPSPRIRSKITLLLDQAGAGDRALRTILLDSEEDPRVRANAVEALWASHREECLTIFRECLNDADNRVAGNAIYGLYAAGQLESIPAMIRMADHQLPAFQTTAVWVMGKTKDPRFLRRVGRFLGEAKGPARRTVFKALESIKTAVQSRAQSKPLSVKILSAERLNNRSVRLLLSVACPDTGASLSIPTTGFVPYVGPEPVSEYFCFERKSDRICVGFILPRRPRTTDSLRTEVHRSLSTCLKAKPKAEHWAISRYHEHALFESQASKSQILGLDSSEPSQIDSHGRNPQSKSFSSNADVLRETLEAPGLRFETSYNAIQAALAVVCGVIPNRGARHIILVADSAESAGSDLEQELIQAAQVSGVCVSAVCVGFDPQIARICSATAGIYRSVETSSSLGAELMLVYSSLKNHYIVEFPCPENSEAPEAISLQVNSEHATGTVDVDLAGFTAIRK